ncbi:epoxide hydrolase [Moniliophthora roreri]|uniref:Uncharacterized protein n=1 Tax=Moniliophthora roreri TaxID=221103 RepID=A0A0W0FXR1_MONRR|nr:epoxide hydrolase [Moniliophthora roreri]
MSPTNTIISAGSKPIRVPRQFMTGVITLHTSSREANLIVPNAIHRTLQTDSIQRQLYRQYWKAGHH